MWMKSWSNSTRAGHAAIPDSRRPDIRIGRAGTRGASVGFRPHPRARTPFSSVVYPCPIPACTKVFRGSRGGWDAHVASSRMHPQWHPDVADPGQRKHLFRRQYADWFLMAATS